MVFSLARVSGQPRAGRRTAGAMRHMATYIANGGMSALLFLTQKRAQFVLGTARTSIGANVIFPREKVSPVQFDAILNTTLNN